MVIQNWMSKLGEGNRLVVQAAANAQRAVDLILGTSFENTDANEELTAEALATAATIVNAQGQALAA
jgi:antirestriction protein ArdC